ncbi:MAG: LON peptidase substrate-binding domain-containing protein [Trueperaceae bacterium]|jgi:Lon protease-like protein|nr:LON peptidase substrate-binding domain-containing protein [Truepera sp.]HRN18833.1 LON peptidase substrate-binding domain-containing protein [Trueperaceae bacterium]HRQ10620.1 LON peptidase substrate-binding domain-containing protein [Trueperaceae bacterium]
MSTLPVFPLDVVVFPGMTVPLHAHEERYKRLVREVLAQEDEPKRFIIAYAEERPSISDLAPRMAGYGTVVHVLSAEENPDGTFDLLVHGQERTRVQVETVVEVDERTGGSRPLSYAEERPAPLYRGDPNEEAIAAWDALDTFRAYAGTRFSGEAGKEIDKHVPEDPFYQASFVCANILVPTSAKQTLLEADSLRERFELARGMMLERMQRRGRGKRGRA